MTDELARIHQELGITARHLAECKLDHCDQPALTDLEIVEIDFEGKPFILHKRTAVAWRKIKEAAAADGILLAPFSGFRAYAYQRQLIRRKLDRGRALDVILTETAIPGFSEHHSGRAVDICTTGCFDLVEEFEKTVAFTWLQENAARFGFILSYPRGNARGIIYEPWHWYFTGS